MDFTRAAPLRDLYPKIAEMRIELEFEDGTDRAPSAQSFSFFPAARGFFRFACPCHTCSGEFDFTGVVAELATERSRLQRNRRMKVSCEGQRIQGSELRAACPITARVRLSATPLTSEQE